MTEPRHDPHPNGKPITAGGARALGLEQALAPYTDALRAQLPSADEIIARAAQRQRDGKRRNQGIALALSLAFGLAWWIDPAYRTQTLRTALGERAVQVLPDGSRIQLNTGTTVTVALHLRSRRLTLDNGEATFEVAHAPWHALLPALERPFTVAAGPALIEDIGTVFNVRRQTENEAGEPSGEQIDISVQTGRVRVHHAHGSVELGTGQRLRSNAARLGEPVAAEVGDLTAWHHGRIVFDNTPLAAVVAELRRHGPLSVTLDHDAAQLRISGQFDLDHRERLIALLPRIAPVRLEQRGDGSIHVSRQSDNK